MSADLLRRAAQLLRDRVAGLGNNIPVWTVEGFSHHGYTSMEYSLPGIERHRGADSMRNPLTVGDDVDLAEYIAMLHPPVAIALADVLEHLAGTVEGTVGDAAAADIFAREMTLAREIMREAPNEYIVVHQRVWMNGSGHGVNYSSSLWRYPSRKAALTAGWKEADSDDFNVGTVVDGKLVAFGWGDNDFGPDEAGDPHGGYDLAEIAQHIGLVSS